MKFQILIPTYNREKDLQNNLFYLRDQIIRYNLAGDFGIVVSDNASTDNTWNILKQLKSEWEEKIQLNILKNEKNVGLEQNAVNLLQHATADYIIWLGDDDLLAEGYLQFAKEQFKKNDIGWMISGLIAVDNFGNKLSSRQIDYSYKHFPSGFKTVYELSHFAHSMSGLIVKRDGLSEIYLSKPEWRNIYLFIYFIAYTQLHYPGIYTPEYQSIINTSNIKDWGYNKIGLLDEVFKSYYYLEAEIGKHKMNKLLLRFVMMHSYRIDFTKGYRYVMKQGKIILDHTRRSSGLKFPLFWLLSKEYLVRKFK